jgi:hypothetical protein
MSFDFYDDEFDDGDYEDVDDPLGILRRDRDVEIDMRDSAGRTPEDADREARIEAGIEAVCRVCGCSESRPCEGGCIWVEVDLCSRCYRAREAMAKAWSAGGSE